MRAGLNQDIKGLGTELKVVNIIIVPAVFALVALLIGLWRRQKRAQRRAQPRSTAPRAAAASTEVRP